VLTNQFLQSSPKHQSQQLNLRHLRANQLRQKNQRLQLSHQSILLPTSRRHCKETSVYILTLSPLLSPINSYSTLCICTSTPTPVPIPIVDDSRLLPLRAPQPHRTSIGYMGTCPRDTTAPSVSHGLMVRRGLEAWCCIGHYSNVLGPSQGSLERSLWIPPD
jgi:hypothetical protein